MKTRQRTPWLCLVGLIWALTGTDRASAQVDPQAREPQDPTSDVEQHPGVDYDSEPPYTLYERWWNRRFPAAYRRHFRREYYPFGRPYYPRRYRSRYPNDFGGGYPYPRYYGGYGTDVFDDGYIDGFGDGRRFQKWEHRAELGLSSYLKAMAQGAAHFRNGDYGTAARQFILAAKVNQGDAAARLHAVHALTALGHYTAAVPALRRALQLQPKLVYLSLDIRSDYGRQEDFAVHLAKLADSAERSPEDAGLWLLLGYYQLYSGSAAEAVESLTQAAELAPNDSAVGKLLEAARYSLPAKQAPAKAPASTTNSV